MEGKDRVITVVPDDGIKAEKAVGTTGHELDPRGVNHPKHYNIHPAGIEAIDVIEHMTLNIGSAIKYLWRVGLKDGEPSLKDLDKAIWYINREKERLRKMPAQPAASPDDTCTCGHRRHVHYGLRGKCFNSDCSNCTGFKS